MGNEAENREIEEQLADQEKQKRLFVSNYDDPKWNRVFRINRILEDELQTVTIENGVILPLRVRDDITTLDEAYEGGVCHEDFSFAAGLRRDYVKENANISVCRGYTVPEEEIRISDETVVFGGILQEQFGDMLTMSMTRLWWYAENPDTPYRFVFLHRPGASAFPEDLFRLIGLYPGRILILTEPTRFARVIIPDEACYILTRASYKWLLPFEMAKEKVREKLAPSMAEKIYLSRTKLQKYGTGDGMNEEYYEKFFADRGYEIVYPESLPIEEQINLIMNAGEIACTFGTLSHLALFAKSGVKYISIIRAPELWIHQSVINYVRELDWYWVEGTINPLPSSHDFGYFLYYPTRYFREFLDSQGISYSEEEFTPAVPDRKMVMQYLENWTKHFADPEYFRRIKDKTSFDYMKSLYMALWGEEIRKNEEICPPLKLETQLKKEKDKTKSLEKRLKEEKEKTKSAEKQLKEEKEKEEELRTELKDTKDLLKETEKERNKAQKQLDQMQESVSWKVTKPLRTVRKMTKQL